MDDLKVALEELKDDFAAPARTGAFVPPRLWIAGLVAAVVIAGALWLMLSRFADERYADARSRAACGECPPQAATKFE